MKIVRETIKVIILGLLLTLTGALSSFADEDNFTLHPVDDIHFNIAYNGPPIMIRLSHHAPETHPIMANVFIPWIEQVKQVSKGKLIIVKYMAGTLHGAKDGFKSLANDVSDFTPGYTVWQPKSFDLEHVLMLPFVFQNNFQAMAVSYELYPKYFKNDYEKMGVVLGSYLTTTANNLISMKPVQKIADLKGMKVTADGKKADMIKLLGAVPVTMPTPELYPSFQRGVTDAIMQTTADMINWKTYEIGKHHLEFNLGHVTLPHALNPILFQKLPPDLKKVFYTMLQLLAWENASYYRWSTIQAVKKMKDKGIVFHTIAEEDKDQWRNKLLPMWSEFIEQNERKGLPAKQCMEDLRKTAEKYATWTPEQIREKMIKAPFPGLIDGM